MNPLALAILAVLTQAPPAEARCLTLSEARAKWPAAYLSWRGSRCWFARGREAGAVIERPSRRPTPTIADGRSLADRADTDSLGSTRTVKTFPVFIKPGEEVMLSGNGTERDNDRPGNRNETRPQPDTLAGADTVPYWWEDDRPEALLMPTRDQWSPDDDHSTALWGVLAAAAFAIAVVLGLAWGRSDGCGGASEQWGGLHHKRQQRHIHRLLHIAR